MRKHTQNIFTIILLLSVSVGFSQRQANDTLNTGVIDVVKPYVPTISDAFKVKETPSLDDETTATKKPVEYNIFSLPVASTFTPAKGKATGLEKKKAVKLFDNYASLGAGNFRTLLGEIYVNHMISRNESVGGYISHHSSNGGVENTVVDDTFSNSKLKLNYESRLRDMSWGVYGGFQHQYYNWYGIAEPIASNEAITDGLDVSNSFFNAHVGANFTFENTYINSGNLLVRRFSDNNGSAEGRATLQTKIDFPVSDVEISTDFKVDYLSGSFKRLFTTDAIHKYGNFQFGVAPSLKLTEEDLSVDLGMSLVYSNDIEAGGSKFFVYPNISASYRLVDDLVITYAGVKGDLIQNTYHNFASENQFVSPTLLVSPTDQVFNAYAGVRGKVTNTVSYDVGLNYVSDKNKALFKSNAILDETSEYDYDYGNSFGIVYDDVTTFSFSGGLNVDVNRNFTLGLKGEYFAYNMDAESEAWNLPTLKTSLFMDYQINEHWFAGANIFLVGERKDQINLESATEVETYTLSSYFDMNFNGGYHVNKQLSVFLKANNITSKGYEKWMNYPVQTFQFLGGATYKFDF